MLQRQRQSESSTVDDEHDDDADVTLLLSPRMDTHELGMRAAQFLIMFDCHEVALQVARDAFERLSHVCPLEFAEELLRSKLEQQIASCYDALELQRDASRWYERSLGTLDDMLSMLVLPRQARVLKQLKGNSCRARAWTFITTYM